VRPKDPSDTYLQPSGPDRSQRLTYTRSTLRLDPSSPLEIAVPDPHRFVASTLSALADPPNVLMGARRIAVLRLDNAGDVILTGPTLRGLRARLPDTELVMVTSPNGAAAAELLPWVDDVVVWRALWQDANGDLPFDPDREFALIDRLRTLRADAALILTSFSQTPFAAGYACYLAGIPIRIGHAGMFGGAVLSHPIAGPAPDHQAERNLHLLRGLGIASADARLEVAVPAAAVEGVRQRLRDAAIAENEPIVVAPGASCSARRYDPVRFGRAAAALRARTGRPVVVVGSADERPLGDAVLASVPDALDLVGSTSIAEAAAMLASAGVVLCNNSLAMHLADAFGRAVVVTYAGTEREGEWRPRSAPHVLLREDTSCSPCRLFDCPFEGHPCMDIAAERVAAAALRLLDDGPLGMSTPPSWARGTSLEPTTSGPSPRPDRRRASPRSSRSAPRRPAGPPRSR
jgi:ADP-heptose:LPS heptosyltransferase